MKNYKTIKNNAQTLTIIEKSKFITYAKPVKDDEEAQRFIKEIKKKHYDANHNVWAYVLGDEMGVQRYSDDGEPSGTAGMPTLEVLKKMGITDACIVTTRYFGGIKLGAGGLIRAYNKCAKSGILDAGVIEMSVHSLFSVEVDYGLVGRIQQDIKEKSLNLKEIEYREKVVFLFYIKPEKLKELMDYFVDITNGTGNIEYICDELLTIDIKEDEDEY